MLAAQNYQPKSLQNLFKKPVKQILRHGMKNKNNYITSKNLKFAKWEPIKDTSLPAPTLLLASTLYPFQKAVMLDVDIGEPKTILKKKNYPKVVNVLREFVDATTITKHILDL